MTDKRLPSWRARASRAVATTMVGGALFVAVSVAFNASILRDAAAEEPLRVFAAASLIDALDEVLAAYELETGRSAIGVYAASGALARQIDAGAPADLFISANPDWAAWLVERGVVADAPEPLIGNALVVASATSRAEEATFEALMDADRIAVADLEAAPAGRYAAQALRSLDLFDALFPSLVQAADARAAAAWVARGEATFGIFYVTDAAAAGLSIAETFPEAAHEPIVYVIMTPKDAQPDADSLMDFILSAPASAIFTEHGFLSPPQR